MDAKRRKRSAELLLGANQNRAKLELRAPSARFKTPMRIQS